MSKRDIANKPDELLDHVNDQDQVIGTVVRKKANSDPQFTHREVGIILVNKEGQVLLQKRSKYKTIHPSMWSITAGHILSGENPEKTAHQELSEELGFDTSLVFIEKEFHRYSHETHFMYYYLGIYTNEELVLEEAEVERVHFFSKEELADLLASDETVNEKHLPIIKKYFTGKFDTIIQQLT